MECLLEIDPKVVSVLFGALVGGGISFITALIFFQKSNRHQANEKFKLAFIDELYQLIGKKDDVTNILNDEAFEKHHRAKIEFEISLKKKELSSFNKDWSKYQNYVTLFWEQEVAPGSIDVRNTESVKAKSHIENLLKYAKKA